MPPRCAHCGASRPGSYGTGRPRGAGQRPGPLPGPAVRRRCARQVPAHRGAASSAERAGGEQAAVVSQLANDSVAAVHEAFGRRELAGVRLRPIWPGGAGSPPRPPAPPGPAPPPRRAQRTVKARSGGANRPADEKTLADCQERSDRGTPARQAYGHGELSRELSGPRDPADDLEVEYLTLGDEQRQEPG
jgi:hypothetical protein